MKLNLIYYKNLLDAAVEKMFASIGRMFSRADDGTYVFSGGWSEMKLARLFEQSLKEVMLEVIAPAAETNDKYIVISSCWPKDNLLLKLKNGSYFPKKLAALVDERPCIKYLLREKDICIDIESLNRIFIDCFSRMFNDSQHVSKLLDGDFSNVIFISHSHLDCYALFKIIKHIYGRSNCVNVWKEKMLEQKQHLVAVNELVSKYISKKTCMNRSRELKEYAREVRDYLKEKIGV